MYLKLGREGRWGGKGEGREARELEENLLVIS